MGETVLPHIKIFEETKMKYLIITIIAICSHILCYASLRKFKLINKNGEKNKLKYDKKNLLAGLLVSCLISVFMISRVYENVDTKLNLIKLIIFYVLLLICAWIDYKMKIIPNGMLLAGMCIRLIVYIFEYVNLGGDLRFELYSEGIALILVVVLLIFAALTHKGIGMGDIKIFGLMALYTGAFFVYSVLFVSVLLGAIIGIVMLLCFHKGKKTTIPFAPLILIGYIITAIVGSY